MKQAQLEENRTKKGNAMSRAGLPDSKTNRTRIMSRSSRPGNVRSNNNKEEESKNMG